MLSPTIVKPGVYTVSIKPSPAAPIVVVRVVNTLWRAVWRRIETEHLQGKGVRIRNDRIRNRSALVDVRLCLRDIKRIKNLERDGLAVRIYQSLAKIADPLHRCGDRCEKVDCLV